MISRKRKAVIFGFPAILIVLGAIAAVGIAIHIVGGTKREYLPKND